MKDQYVLTLDQGTTSSRAILFDKKGQMVVTSQKEFTQIFPKPGWVEHNPCEIWETQIGSGTPPPMVLILSGWTMSNDYEKKDRWARTIDWAEQNNCSNLIPEVKDGEKYYED